MVDRFLSKWAAIAIVGNVNNFVVEWRFPAEWHLPAQEILKATFNWLKALLKVVIYANLRHGVQMFSQISHIPDLIRKFWAKKCGLYAGVYGICIHLQLAFHDLFNVFWFVNPLTPGFFCQKCNFLDILEIFWLDIGGSQISFNPVKKASATWQLAFLFTSITFYGIFISFAAVIGLLIGFLAVKKLQECVVEVANFTME